MLWAAMVFWALALSLRATSVGARALGQGFLWSDLTCYALGATIALVLDAIVMRKTRLGRTIL